MNKNNTQIITEIKLRIKAIDNYPEQVPYEAWLQSHEDLKILIVMLENSSNIFD